MATGTLIADTLNCASGVFPTHLDERGKGGFMVLPGVPDRDGLDPSLLKIGMIVHTQDDGCTYQLISLTKDGYASEWKEITLEELKYFTNKFQAKGNLTDDIKNHAKDNTAYPSTKGVVDYLDANYTTSFDYTITTVDGSGNSQNVTLDDLHTGNVKLLTPDSKIVYRVFNDNPYSKHSLWLEAGVTRDGDSNVVEIPLYGEYSVVYVDCYISDITLQPYLDIEGNIYYPECYVYLINKSGGTLNLTFDQQNFPTDALMCNRIHNTIAELQIESDDIGCIKFTRLSDYILYDAIRYSVDN